MTIMKEITIFSNKQQATSTKKRLFLLFATIFLSTLLSAQNQYLNGVNTQLRHIFSQITYPDNDVLFLYDRSAKLSDSTFYSNNSVDTASAQIWRQVYDEMYYAAHDTLPLETINNIHHYTSQFYSDTILMGLFDYDFYYCSDNSLTTGDYFTFDTVNNYLLDHPNPIGSPYGVSNIFLSAPLKETSNFANPVFRIDPQLFFTDAINTLNYQAPPNDPNFMPIRIDFEDGTGWHYFDMNSVSHYEANYTTEGKHIITVELLDFKGLPIKSSKSKVYTLKSTKSIPPDYLLEGVEGLEVGVYGGCESESDEKIIIYLEGFDMLDMKASSNKGVKDIYDAMIKDQSIENLRNFNYTYYIVDWHNSRIDMRFNALYVLNLIEKLKKLHQENEEQIVIIGESMGGVIARYVLSFMESEAYQAGDFSSFFVEEGAPENIHYLRGHEYLFELGLENRDEELVYQNHKTRELITLDSPHQGANIPLSIQYAYRKLLKFVVPGGQHLTSMLNLGLESYAAKQLLLYHIDGKINPLGHVSGYLPHPAHVSFYDQLREMGYPKYCKNVALSSGSLSGANQHNMDGYFRTAGDILLDQNLDLYARILWLKHPILKTDFILRTNPDGTGTFYSAGVGSFTIQIKLKLFGVKLNSIFGSIYSDNQIAVDVKPYCVSAGGYYDASIGSFVNSSQFTLSQHYFLNLFGYNLQGPNNGCFSLKAHVGWNGFSSTNLDFALCSDGTKFNFVPLHSALDYGGGMNVPLNHNILAENINTKLQRTPFDVIIGYPDENNRYHLNYRDENIYNITGQDATSCQNSSVYNGRYAYYDADLLYKCKIRRSFLCLEIGDEELYMENWKLNRNAKFQTQYALYVNKRNPYYEYPSQLPQTIDLEGIYSKENPFQITNQGYAKFVTNGNDSPISNGFVYNPPHAPINLWSINDEVVMKVCMEEYNTKSFFPITDEESPNESNMSNELRIYPNPNKGNLLMIALGENYTEKVAIDVLDITGKSVVQHFLQESSDNTIQLDLHQLQKGMYLVRIKNHERQEVKRLVIH